MERTEAKETVKSKTAIKMMTTCDSLKSATRRKVGRTDIYTSLFVCLILTVLRTATSSGVQGADVEETAAGTNSIIAGSHLLPDGNISSTLDNNATSSQSIYFISVLFEKYSSSKLQLSLDGFTQLLCNLGLLHINDETGQADEISSAFKFVCKNITYSAFRAQNRVKHDSRQDQERTHAQADDDGDHDHNPNPFIMTTSSQEQPANDHTRGLHCFNHLHHNGDHFLGDHVSGALSDVTTHASRRKRTANIFKAVERRSLPSTTSKGQQLSSAAPWGYLNLAKVGLGCINDCVLHGLTMIYNRVFCLSQSLHLPFYLAVFTSLHFFGVGLSLFTPSVNNCCISLPQCL